MEWSRRICGPYYLDENTRKKSHQMRLVALKRDWTDLAGLFEVNRNLFSRVHPYILYIHPSVKLSPLQMMCVYNIRPFIHVTLTLKVCIYIKKNTSRENTWKNKKIKKGYLSCEEWMIIKCALCTSNNNINQHFGEILFRSSNDEMPPYASPLPPHGYFIHISFTRSRR